MNSKICEYLNCSKFRSFNETLFYYIDKSGHKDSEVYKRVDIDRKLFSKIRCNQDYIPRKNVIIKLCFSLKLNKSDLIICYCLDNNIYDLNVINDYLFTYCNAIL